MSEARVYTVAIINEQYGTADPWISAFSTREKAEVFSDAALKLIGNHYGWPYVVQSDSGVIDSEEYLRLLESEYGNEDRGDEDNGE